MACPRLSSACTAKCRVRSGLDHVRGDPLRATRQKSSGTDYPHRLLLGGNHSGKVMLRTFFAPVHMFCCGCSVRFGVGCIVLCHTIVCVFYVGSAVSNIVFKNAFFSSSWSPAAQLFYTAFALVGIPIGAMAFWGVIMLNEINIRIYFFYLAFSCLLDLVALVYVCMIEDPCNTVNYFMDSVMQSGSRQTISGEAFMCGAYRIINYILVTLAICIELYCLYIVWSMCEDIHCGKNGPELHQLIPGKDVIVEQKKKAPDGPYAGIVGFAHTSVPGPYPNAYGTIRANPGAIFGGNNHETDYPPRQPGPTYF